MLENGKPELLVPASSLEVLKVAVMYGADAVYIGGEMYGLRAKAKNFSMEDMAEGIRFAHEYGKRVFVTANITAHNRDLEGVRKYFRELHKIGPDALIISDPGVFTIAREVCPEIEVHISTQSNNVNYETYLFWQRLVPNEWFRRGNCPLKKLQRFGLIFRMTWRLKHLYMERCVFPTPAVAF